VGAPVATLRLDDRTRLRESRAAGFALIGAPTSSTDESTGTSGPPRGDDRFATLFRWTAAVGIGALLAGSALLFFTVDVCDEQLSSSGAAVEVCRHMQLSDPPVLAIALVVLAALGVFFTEVSGFGVTLKRQVRAASETAERARQVATRNSERLEETAGDLADLGRAVVAAPERRIALETPADDVHPTIGELADRYNEIRLTMPSGHLRTAEMEALVNRMISAFEDVPDFDVERNLVSRNRGLRLAAYARLFARPEPRWTPALVDSLIDHEDKPFGQYWALRALRRQCETDPTALSGRTRRRVVDELQPRLAAGSDRAGVLRRVLEQCSPGSASDA
jgi:hypothetical protein